MRYFFKRRWAYDSSRQGRPNTRPGDPAVSRPSPKPQAPQQPSCGHAGTKNVLRRLIIRHGRVERRNLQVPLHNYHI